MEDAIIALGKHDHLVPGLLEELAPPALPTHGLPAGGLLFTPQPIRRGQRKHEPREQHMHPYRPFSFLRRMAQVPLLFRFLDAAVLDQTAVVIVVKRSQGLLYRGVGQENGFAPRP